MRRTRFFAYATLLLLGLSTLPLSVPGETTAATGPTGNAIVGFKGPVPPDAQVIVARNGGILIKDLSPLHAVLVHTTNLEAFRFTMAYESSVAYVTKDQRGALHSHLAPTSPPNDTRYDADQKSYLAAEGFPAAWSRAGFGDPNLLLAVIDSGIDAGNRELAPHLWSDGLGGYGYDLANGLDQIDNEPEDLIGHGTSTAGIAAAIAGNGDGMAGAAGNVRILPIRVAGASATSVSVAAVAYGITLAVQAGAKVILVPAGFGDPDPTLYNAVLLARGANRIVVASAGNGNLPVQYPAAYDEVLAVGAVKLRGDGTPYIPSTARLAHGPQMDVAGVGGIVVATCNDPIAPSYPTCTVGSDIATSWAVPQVAGAAALLVSCRPLALVDEVHAALKTTAQPVEDGPYTSGQPDDATGHGLINVDAALTEIGC